MRPAQEKMEAGDPLKVAANVAGLILENERVRVMRGVLKPGGTANLHSHPDHVVYVIKGGFVQLIYPDGKVDSIEMEQGKAMFMKAQSHEVRNTGETEVEFIVVELK